MAQTLKNLPARQETWVQSLGEEDPQEKETVTHFSIIAWEIPWTEEPGGLWSTGVAKSQTRLSNTFMNLNSPVTEGRGGFFPSYFLPYHLQNKTSASSLTLSPATLSLVHSQLQPLQRLLYYSSDIQVLGPLHCIFCPWYAPLHLSIWPTFSFLPSLFRSSKSCPDYSILNLQPIQTPHFLHFLPSSSCHVFFTVLNHILIYYVMYLPVNCLFLVVECKFHEHQFCVFFFYFIHCSIPGPRILSRTK